MTLPAGTAKRKAEAVLTVTVAAVSKIEVQGAINLLGAIDGLEPNASDGAVVLAARRELEAAVVLDGSPGTTAREEALRRVQASLKTLI